LKTIVDGFETALSKQTKTDLYKDFVLASREAGRRLIPEVIFCKDFIRPIIALKLMRSEKAYHFEDVTINDINYILQLKTNHQTAKDIETNIYRFLKHPKNRKKTDSIYATLQVLLEENT